MKRETQRISMKRIEVSVCLAAMVVLLTCKYDLNTVKRPTVDALVDRSVDTVQVDAPVPDRSPLDSPRPDKAPPDSPRPDKALPDKALLDLGMKPDQHPIKHLTDKTFTDFNKGTLSEGGAKIYVSAKGQVELVDRLDVDNNGYLDLVMVNHVDNIKGVNKHDINSYVYKSSALGLLAIKEDLPTNGASGAVLADLNSDGWPDAFFSNKHEDQPKVLNSYIYYGSSVGVGAKLANVPTCWAVDSTTADINRDGFLDLIVSNQCAPGSGVQIYWGSSSGYSAIKSKSLAAATPTQAVVADLNGDHKLDIVICSFKDGKSLGTNSQVLWGDGFTSSTKLPTVGCTGTSAADLNGDGWPDLVFANQHNVNVTTRGNSYIYWNQQASPWFQASPGAKHRSEIPTVGANDVSVADLNHDKKLDLIFSNLVDEPGANHHINSYVYWNMGSAPHFSTSARLEIPTDASYGNFAADLNNDGYTDLVFTNHFTGTYVTRINSYVYWNQQAAPWFVPKSGAKNRKALPSIGAVRSSTDPGSVLTREGRQTFTSRVLLTQAATPQYLKIWSTAKVPKGTGLSFQVRAAATAAGLKTAAWMGPTSAKDAHVVSDGVSSSPLHKSHTGHSYLQYRATLTHDLGNTPVLQQVSVAYQ